MAEDKKSFILYADQIHLFENLDDAEAGALIKHIFRYVNDQNPICTDKITKIAFEPIKHQLKRDLIKWEKFREKQSENGKRGGRPKNPSQINENPKNPSLLEETQKSLNVNVNVNDTVNVKREREHTRLGKKFDLDYFAEQGRTWELPDELAVALNKFLEYRSRHPDYGPIKSPEQVEAIIREFISRKIPPEDAVKMIDRTISKGAKNMIYELEKQHFNGKQPRKTGQPDIAGVMDASDQILQDHFDRGDTGSPGI